MEIKGCAVEGSILCCVVVWEGNDLDMVRCILGYIILGMELFSSYIYKKKLSLKC